MTYIAIVFVLIYFYADANKPTFFSNVVKPTKWLAYIYKSISAVSPSLSKVFKKAT